MYSGNLINCGELRVDFIIELEGELWRVESLELKKLKNSPVVVFTQLKAVQSDKFLKKTFKSADKVLNLTEDYALHQRLLGLYGGDES